MIPTSALLAELLTDDPLTTQEKVLAFGQSAGATDVYTLTTLAEAPSLFKSAIIESIALPQLTDKSIAQKLGVSFAKGLQCSRKDVS